MLVANPEANTQPMAWVMGTLNKMVDAGMAIKGMPKPEIPFTMPEAIKISASQGNSDNRVSKVIQYWLCDWKINVKINN